MDAGFELTQICSLGNPVEKEYCNTDVKITYPQLPVSGKQISDDEFLHTVNVSFAVLTESVKTTQFQMLSLSPDREQQQYTFWTS